MTAKPTPRGIRNNNPGNIRHENGTRWQGMAAAQTDKAFVQFLHSRWGIRAIARVLITYQDKHKLRTIKGIIDRWAPPVENDTAAYIRSVAQSLGITATQRIDVYDYSTMRALVIAIIRHENGTGPLIDGGWYSNAVIDGGLTLAGIAQNTHHGDTE